MVKMRNKKYIYACVGLTCLVLCIAIMLSLPGRDQVSMGQRDEVSVPTTHLSLLAGGALATLPIMSIAQTHVTKTSAVQEKRSPYRTRTRYYHSSSSSHGGPMAPWEWLLLIGAVVVVIIIGLAKYAASSNGDNGYYESEYYRRRDDGASNRGRIWSNDPDVHG